MIFSTEPSYSFDVGNGGFEIQKPKVSDWHTHTYPELHNGYASGMNEKYSNGDRFSQDFDMGKMPQYQSRFVQPQPILPPSGTFIPPSMMLGGY